MVVEPLAREFGPVFGLSQASTLFLTHLRRSLRSYQAICGATSKCPEWRILRWEFAFKLATSYKGGMAGF